MRIIFLLATFSLTGFTSSFNIDCSNSSGSIKYNIGFKDSLKLEVFNTSTHENEVKSYKLGNNANVEINFTDKKEISTVVVNGCDSQPSASRAFSSVTKTYLVNISVNIIDEEIRKQSLLICERTVSNLVRCN